MSANNNSAPSSNSSPEDKSADRSLLEKAGLSEGELEPPEESSRDCVVCQNGAVNWVLLPCRHACLCDGCVRHFQQCPMCRQLVQESFALGSQKEQDKDKLKKTLWGCHYILKLRSTLSTEDAEICVLGIHHNMESTVLTINKNSILTSCLYGWWQLIISSCSVWWILEYYLC